MLCALLGGAAAHPRWRPGLEQLQGDLNALVAQFNLNDTMSLERSFVQASGLTSAVEKCELNQAVRAECMAHAVSVMKTQLLANAKPDSGQIVRAAANLGACDKTAWTLNLELPRDTDRQYQSEEKYTPLSGNGCWFDRGRTDTIATQATGVCVKVCALLRHPSRLPRPH
jgi:hypothetical protein